MLACLHNESVEYYCYGVAKQVDNLIGGCKGILNVHVAMGSNITVGLSAKRTSYNKLHNG